MSKRNALAQALCKEGGGDPLEWQDWLPAADAAFEVLRVPSEAMKKEWAHRSPVFTGTSAACAHAAEVWGAMIDAAIAGQ